MRGGVEGGEERKSTPNGTRGWLIFSHTHTQPLIKRVFLEERRQTLQEKQTGVGTYSTYTLKRYSLDINVELIHWNTQLKESLQIKQTHCVSELVAVRTLRHTATLLLFDWLVDSGQGDFNSHEEWTKFSCLHSTHTVQTHSTHTHRTNTHTPYTHTVHTHTTYTHYYLL